jgi:hypothetical protein
MSKYKAQTNTRKHKHIDHIQASMSNKTNPSIHTWTNIIHVKHNKDNILFGAKFHQNVKTNRGYDSYKGKCFEIFKKQFAKMVKL